MKKKYMYDNISNEMFSWSVVDTPPNNPPVITDSSDKKLELPMVVGEEFTKIESDVDTNGSDTSMNTEDIMDMLVQSHRVEETSIWKTCNIWILTFWFILSLFTSCGAFYLLKSPVFNEECDLSYEQQFRIENYKSTLKSVETDVTISRAYKFDVKEINSETCNNLPLNGVSLYVVPSHDIFYVSVLCKWMWYGSWHGKAPSEYGKTCGLRERILRVDFDSETYDFNITCSKNHSEVKIIGVVSIIHSDGLHLKSIYKMTSNDTHGSNLLQHIIS